MAQVAIDHGHGAASTGHRGCQGGGNWGFTLRCTGTGHEEYSSLWSLPPVREDFCEAQVCADISNVLHRSTPGLHRRSLEPVIIQKATQVRKTKLIPYPVLTIEAIIQGDYLEHHHQAKHQPQTKNHTYHHSDLKT